MEKCSNCNLPVQNKKHGLCIIHEWERKHPGEDYRRRHKAKQAKKTPVKKVGDKMKVRLQEYKVVRDDYMKSHRRCEVAGCFNEATELHHKKGRENGLLTDTAYFMAVCHGCHARIDLEPEWARVNGYSIRRF
jgi:hypothetical protein